METLSSSKIESWLPWFLRGCLFLGFLVLFGRLIELQIIKGAYFKTLAEGNRIRRVPIVAPRGKIFARGGELLVGNTEVKKRLVFYPKEGYEKLDDLKGARDDDEIITEWIRDYILSSNFAHVSGYLGEVNKEEIGKVNSQCPEKGPRRLGSLVGRTGLEGKYECTLSGIDGEELVEVDSGGNKIRVLGRREPIAGENIKTSVHFGLQNKVAEIMSERKDLPFGRQGAIVVTDTKGEVLALYSSPSYDPNVFIKKDLSEISKIFESSDLPLFNRAIGGAFHPGSIVKPLFAIAALEEGEIEENFVYDDPGIITIQTPYGTFSYANWYFTQYGRKEGEIDIVRAITRSTDTFFYKLGELVGVNRLNLWANKFGLGIPTGIDIPGETAGLIPSSEWKEKVRGERWFLGNTYHMSIGQGDITLTPIGINTAISAIASSGIYCTPHFIMDVESGDFPPGQRPLGPEANFQLARRSLGEGGCRDLEISKKTIDLVKEGMVGACSPGGTGFTFFDFPSTTSVRDGQAEPVNVACKTGTAETGDGETTHAWFTAFAPVDFPEIVATVLVEKGGEGSYVAGPIAREIFDYWFLQSD